MKTDKIRAELKKLTIAFATNSFPSEEFSDSSTESLFSINDLSPSTILGFGFSKDKDGAKDVIKIYARKNIAKKDRISSHRGMDVLYEIVGDDLYDEYSPMQPNSYTYRNENLTCGSSIGYTSTSAGTLGAVLKIEGKYFGLSNNHVLGGCNFTPLGTQIYWPSQRDLQPSKTESIHTVGRLSKVHPLLFGHLDHIGENLMDAAIFSIDESINISSYQREYFDTPSEISEPRIGMKVKKVGRTTGLTLGQIDTEFPVKGFSLATGRTVPKIPYMMLGPIWGINSLEKDDDESKAPFSLGGDSGSLVVSEDESKAVGIIMGGAKYGFSYMCPIKPILDYFNAELVSGYKI